MTALKQLVEIVGCPKLPVTEAIRTEEGRYSVSGMIVSVSAPYKLIDKTDATCNLNCGKQEVREHHPPLFSATNEVESCSKCDRGEMIKHSHYITAVTIQLQDNNPSAELERLDVILKEKDTYNVHAGEQVEVEGTIFIQKLYNKKLIPVLYAESIKYSKREEIVLTDKDVQVFQKFACYPSVLERLAAMFAPNVIGHKDKKLAILRSAVGAPDNGRRGRIHTLLAGSPGTSKTTLAREAVKLVPNARYVSAQNASGKSITAIIDKENDCAVLRMGQIPLAKNSICSINEIGALHFEDQAHLSDAMEEGFFTVDKHGIHQNIDSPTTVIATTNPTRIDWTGSKIDKNEIPIRRDIFDRFDQVCIFRDFRDEEARDYADLKVDYDERKVEHNYNYLTKYVLHAKTIEPVVSKTAREMLKEFWVQLKVSGAAANRTLDSLFRISKAMARLHLRSIVDEEIAKEAMRVFQTLLAEYGEAVSIVATDPREKTYETIVKAVESIDGEVTFEEALKLAIKMEPQTEHYIGHDLKVQSNYRLRTIRSMFVEGKDKRLVITGLKPLTLAKSCN